MHLEAGLYSTNIPISGMQLAAVGMRFGASQVVTDNCSRRLPLLPWKELPVRMSSFMLLMFA